MHRFQDDDDAPTVAPARSASPPRVIVTFVMLVLAQLASGVAINVITDPRSEFGTGLFEPLAGADEFEIKWGFYRQAGGSAHTLVLGSSRAMKLAPGDIAEKGHGEAFNFALSASTARDVLWTYEQLTENGPPAEIIYGLEPDQLLEVRTDRWSRVEENISAAKALVTAVKSYQRSYLLDSINVFRYTLTEYPEKAGQIDPDGLFHYVQWEAATPRAPAKADAQALQGGIGFDDLTISAAQTESVRALAVDAAASGAMVHVFLTPPHPALRAKLIEDPQCVAARAQTLELAASLCGPRVRVHDFEDVASFGGHPDDFRDLVHYGPDNARAIVHALYTEPGICP